MKYMHIMIIAAILLLANCSNESGIQTETPRAKISFAVREGYRLFSHYCSPCHGENADGNGKYLGFDVKPTPPDITATDFLQNRSDSLLALVISKGSVALGKSNLCPAWGTIFHENDIEFLVVYIKNINERANK